jgi:hypothetical protein
MRYVVELYGRAAVHVEEAADGSEWKAQVLRPRRGARRGFEGLAGRGNERGTGVCERGEVVLVVQSCHTECATSQESAQASCKL